MNACEKTLPTDNTYRPYKIVGLPSQTSLPKGIRQRYEGQVHIIWSPSSEVKDKEEALETALGSSVKT